MAENKQLGFFPVLRLGVRRLLRERDYNISSYERLEVAFGHGILGAREAIARDRPPEVYGRKLLPELVRRAFPLSGTFQHPDTRTLHVPIAWQVMQPSLVDTAWELHVFLDNSGDSLRQLLATLNRVVGDMPLTQYLALEIMGELDPRPASAILVAYGTGAESRLVRIAQQLDVELDATRLGFSLDYLYPLRRTSLYAHEFAPGAFRQRRQQIFTAIWDSLQQSDVLLLSQLETNYDALMKRATVNLQALL